MTTGANTPIDRWRDRLGLALLAAMVLIPFLHSRHFNPIPSFWAEWWAVALGLAAAAVLLVRDDAWRPAHLPGIMLLPLIFCGAAMLQVGLRQALFVEQALLYAAMLLWAALMMLVGRQARERFGLERLVDLLATALLAGALANAIIALLQWQHGTAFAYPWIFPLIPGHEPYGNLGQRNHLSHHLWLGIVSAAYLQMRGRMSLKLMWAGLLPLLFVATLTTSRSALLYAAMLPLLGWPLARLGQERAEVHRWIKLALTILVVVVLLQWIVKNLGIWAVWLGLELPGLSTTFNSASDRFFQEISGTDIRLRLLAAAWREFSAAPWLGNGIGSFPWQLFLANEQVGAEWAPGVAEHAHNILFHWLAEFGLIPTVLALAVLAWWARRFFSGRWQLQHLWIAAILGIAAIHSLLEYPLWYGFFLGLAALLLGISDTATLEVHNGRRGTLLAGAVIIGAMAPLGSLRQDYAVLEAALNRRHSTASIRGDIDNLLRLQGKSLLSPHVLVTLAVTMEPDREQLDAKIAVCELAQRFAPSKHIVFKCAVLLQLAGRDDAAATQMRRALRAFPEERQAVTKELQQMAAGRRGHEVLARLARLAQVAQTVPPLASEPRRP